MRYRIRSLKPELFRDERVARWPLPQRLLWVGLIAHADDHGRLEGHPSALRSLIFPLDDFTVKKIDSMLKSIADSGRIHRYQSAGLDYIEIVNWSAHQKVNRPSPSRIPAYSSVNGNRPDAEPEP